VLGCPFLAEEASIGEILWASVGVHFRKHRNGFHRGCVQVYAAVHVARLKSRRAAAALFAIVFRACHFWQELGSGAVSREEIYEQNRWEEKVSLAATVVATLSRMKRHECTLW
jgi:hypothetical protein